MMSRIRKCLSFCAWAAAVSLALTGCGSGSGGGGGGETPTSSSLGLTGVAAQGVALSGAAVSVKCAVGIGAANTAGNGSYSVSIPSGSLPCLIEVTGSGGSPVYHAAVAGTGSGSFTLNASPLTELVMAQVTGAAGTTTTGLFAGYSASSVAVTPATLAAGLTYLRTALGGMVNLTGVNPLSDPLVAANGSTRGNTLDTLIDTLIAQIVAARTTFGAVAGLVAANPTTPATVAQSLQYAFSTLVPTMTTPRMGHTATLLGNGKVLIAGGAATATPPNLADAALDTAELYDPVANTFTAIAAPMTSARHQHSATLLPTGKVLIAGGHTTLQGDGINSAELYDPVANTFTAIPAAMTTGRGGHAAVLLPDNTVLIVGGYFNGATNLTSAEVYDPVADTFTALAATTTGPSGGVAFLLPGGKALIASGSFADVYDPVAQTFTALGNAPTFAGLFTATPLASGSVLVTGGCGSAIACSPPSIVALNTVQVYDPLANILTPVSAPLNSARTLHAASLLSNGKVLVTGGIQVVNGTYIVLNTAELD